MNGALISPNETKHHLKVGGQVHPKKNNPSNMPFI